MKQSSNAGKAPRQRVAPPRAAPPDGDGEGSDPRAPSEAPPTTTRKKAATKKKTASKTRTTKKTTAAKKKAAATVASTRRKAGGKTSRPPATQRSRSGPAAAGDPVAHAMQQAKAAIARASSRPLDDDDDDDGIDEGLVPPPRKATLRGAKRAREGKRYSTLPPPVAEPVAAEPEPMAAEPEPEPEVDAEEAEVEAEAVVLPPVRQEAGGEDAGGEIEAREATKEELAAIAAAAAAAAAEAAAAARAALEQLEAQEARAEREGERARAGERVRERAAERARERARARAAAAAAEAVPAAAAEAAAEAAADAVPAAAADAVADAVPEAVADAVPEAAADAVPEAAADAVPEAVADAVPEAVAADVAVDVEAEADLGSWSDPATGTRTGPGRRLAPKAVPLRRRYALRLGIGAIVVSSLLTLVPYFVLARAQQRTAACFDEVVAAARGDAGACLPAAWQMGLLRRLPWFEADAGRLWGEARYRAAVLAYGQATAIVPARAAREAAAEALIGLSAETSLPEGPPPLSLLDGAFGIVSRAAVQSDDPALRARGFVAARALADEEAWRALATTGDANDDAAANLMRGAAACLLGDGARGGEQLVWADDAHRRADAGGTPLDAARIALLACGRDGGAIDPRNVGAAHAGAVAAIEASRRHVAGLDRVRELLDAPGLSPAARLHLLPHAIADERGTPELLDVLAVLAPRHAEAPLEAPAPWSPWSLLAAPAPDLIAFDTTAGRRAAERLEALADGIDDGPIACGGGECPHEAAITLPRSTLREAARRLWLQLGIAAAQRGLRGEAIAAARRVAALAPERGHLAAPIHLAVGDAPGALALLAPPADDAPAATRFHVCFNRALALAGEDLARAHDDAARAYAAAVAASGQAPGEARDEARIAAAWLWAASALAANRAADVREVMARADDERLGALAEWLELAALDEPERRPLRWNAALALPPTASLPAAMFVVAQAVPRGADVEVWLDRIFDESHRRQPLLSMLARASLARWRGDEEAAIQWADRAARLHAHMGDASRALLAEIAGAR